MSSISAAALLEAWEDGRDASPGERGMLLLRLAHPETPVGALAGWTVGRRDAALLKLFEQNFGSELEALAECPQCHEPLEMDFPVSAVKVSAPCDGRDRFAVESGGYRVVYRLPTAGDFAALGDPSLVFDGKPAATRWLLQRCMVEAEQLERPEHMEKRGARARRGERAKKEAGRPAGQLSVSSNPQPASGLPDAVFGALEMAMAETVAAADPQAEIVLALGCPACGLQWSAPFDIVSFLWEEIGASATRLLGEVHIMASIYGWSERDILMLNPWRRRYYLDLIGA